MEKIELTKRILFINGIKKKHNQYIIRVLICINIGAPNNLIILTSVKRDITVMEYLTECTQSPILIHFRCHL